MIERILDRRWVGEHLRSLSEIVEQERRQHQAEPCSLDRLAPEMTEVGVERLPAGDHQKYGAERDQPDLAVVVEKSRGVVRVYREQHAGIIVDMEKPRERDGGKPDHQ